MHRILIPLDSHDPESWQYALAYVDQIGKARGQHGDVILLVHTRCQINGSRLSGHMGSGHAKALNAGKSMKLPFGGSLRLATLKTLGHVLKGTIIIAFFTDEKMLGAVDDRRGLAGVVVVPDFTDSADEWASRWSPVVHGQSQPVAQPLIDDRIVEAVLDCLTRMINLSTGLSNPRDKDAANEILRILEYKGHVIDLVKLRSWAIQNGWRSGDAHDLSQLAGKIGSLKNKPSMAKIYNWQDKYERWASV
jgi:hypothetical protein